MRNDQGGFIKRRNDVGHRKGFTGTGNAKKGFKLVSRLKSLH